MYFDNLNNLTPNDISHFADGIAKCLNYAKITTLLLFPVVITKLMAIMSI